MALSFLRKAHTVAARGNIAEVLGGLPLDVAYYLLNRKKRELVQIETDYGIEVTVKGKPSFMMNQIELELQKKEKGLTVETGLEQAVSEPETELPATKPVSVSTGATVEGEEPKGKKKRRRHKKKPLTAAETVAEEAATLEEAAEAIVSIEHELPEPSLTPAAITQEEAESPASELKKKRRRRRRRSAKPQQPEEALAETVAQPEETASVAPETAPEIPVAPTVAEELTAEKPEKKKPVRKKKPAKKAEAKELLPEPEKSEAAEKSVPVLETPEIVEARPSEPTEEAPKKKSRPRKKKEPVQKTDDTPLQKTAGEEGATD
jgi:ribonuclease E